MVDGALVLSASLLPSPRKELTEAQMVLRMAHVHCHYASVVRHSILGLSVAVEMIQPQHRSQHCFIWAVNICSQGIETCFMSHESLAVTQTHIAVPGTPLSFCFLNSYCNHRLSRQTSAWHQSLL